MLIVCPSCATSYQIEAAKLQPDGRPVRCARCRTIWHAELSEPPGPGDSSQSMAIEAARAGPSAEAAVETGMVPAIVAAEADDGRMPPQESSDARAGFVANAWTAGSSEPDFPVEVEAPPIAPGHAETLPATLEVAAEPLAPGVPSLPADVETLAARRPRRKVKRVRPLWSFSRLQTVTLVLLILDAVLLGWRQDIVRALPQTASLYAAMGLAVNLRGLSFDEVATKSEAGDGIPILVVQGNIVNDTGTAISVPHLKLTVRNAGGQEIYSWTAAPPRPILSPHEAVGFRTRLASPPPEGRDVMVRFVNDRDRVADVH